MTFLDPLLAAPLAIQIHACGAVVAIALLPFALLRRRRDIWHNTAGYFWVITMAIVAVSSFFIHGFAIVGPFGPIHLISIYVLVGLWRAISAARRGRIAEHRGHMVGIAIGGLGVAGSLSFLPDRLMARMVFEGLGYWGVAVAAIIALLAIFLTSRHPALRPIGANRAGR